MSAIAMHSDAIEFGRQVSPVHAAVLLSAYGSGQRHNVVTPADICGWHRALFPAGGYYRTCAAYFYGSGEPALDAGAIPGAMLTLCADTNWLIERARLGVVNSMVALATVHWRFEKIHPFSDGNGRVGRVLLQYMAGALSLPPICLKESQRDRYIKLLESNDINGLASLFISTY